jgi:hypothetical protein
MTARRLLVRLAAGAASVAFVGLGATVAGAAPTATNATATLQCPGATSGAADGGSPTSGACGNPVTGTDDKGQVGFGGTITYSSCGDTNILGFATDRACSSVTLTLSPPTGSTDKTISLSLGEAKGSKSTSATGVIPPNQDNGTWTATFSGDATGSATFVLDVPPSVPGVPTLDLSTPGQATVTWAVSAPTSASSYALTVDGLPTTLTPDCSAGSTCTGTVTGLSGGSHTFAVTGSRPDGNGGQATSQPASASGTVTAVPASSTAPSSSPTTGSSGSGGSTTTAGGSTGSTGTVATGGTKTGTTGTTKTGTTGTTTSGTTASTAASQIAAAAAAQRRAESFQSFAPAAGIAQLPPLPKFPAAAAPDDGEPTSQGTYVPTLPYNGQQTVTEKISKPTLLGHVTNVVSDRELLESVCGAALVLLIAAHLRVLARRDPTADL